MCLEGGKRQRELAVAAVSGSRSCLAVTDSVSKREFLVDTGAEVSIIPATTSDKALNTSPHDYRTLRAANGTRIPSYGSMELTVCIEGTRFRHRFIIADVKQALMGADFLLNNNLLVDLPGHRLLRAKTLTPFTGAIRPSEGMTLGVSCDTNDAFQKLLHLYPRVTQADFAQHEPRHGVTHTISTESAPVWSRPRRLNPEKLKAAKKEFDNLLRLGIVQPSVSQWASPLHMVRKPNGEWRPCGDYRRLNAITTPDRYPVPHIQDFAAQLIGTAVFSKIDLIRGYHQIPVAEEDRKRTAVTTPFGLFEFLRMPFGLRNAGQTFQRAMHAVLQGLPNVYVYIDDILVASGNRKEHLQHVKLVLDRLQEHGLLIRPEKCEFGKQKLTFLGHEISADGIRPLPDRVMAIRNYPQPSTAKQLQKFLGMVNYYHRFIPRASVVLQPLHALCQEKASKKPLVWSDTCVHAFTKIKQLLSDATLLAFPADSAPMALCTDASEVGMGAVLEQLLPDGWQPLAFFSRAFDNAQKKYSTFDRELLAAHAAARHFTYMLDGRLCTLFTDHKPLVHAWKRSGEAWSARQQRHLSTLAETFADVQHKEGKHNVVADALSRDAIQAVYQTISPERLQQEQANDDDTRDARTAITGMQLQDEQIGDSTVLCDISLGYPRPLVPPSLRREVFDVIHGLAHPGVRATRRLISRDFVWHRMNHDVTQWCRQCSRCQQCKIQRHTKTPVPTIPVPSRAFSHVHVDIVGPLPFCRGYTYLFTIVDRFSRWPDAIPLRGITAEECAEAFVLQWVARHGLPRDITSDRGRQFISQVWQSLGESLGSRIHHTTSYHPQANGLVERFHRTMKNSLRASLTDDNWVRKLPWVLLGLRTTLKEDLGSSPAEMIYQQALNLPGNVVDVGPSNTVPVQPSTVKHHQQQKSFVPPGLETCKSVWLRNDRTHRSLDPPYTGPYPVLSRHAKYYVIKIFGSNQTVSLDRLKPALTGEDSIYPRTRSGRVNKPPRHFS